MEQSSRELWFISADGGFLDSDESGEGNELRYTNFLLHLMVGDNDP